MTCHHNIYQMESIHVEKDNRRYDATWVEELSSPSRDIAALRVKDCSVQPLECAKEARPRLHVDVWGFPIANIGTFPNGRTVDGRLGRTLTRFHWNEERSGGSHKWNVKPEVNVDVFQVESKAEQGFSGGPISYSEDNVVVGMLEAKDDNFGYLIPIQIILDIFQPERVAPPRTHNIDSPSLILAGDMFASAGEHERAIFWYNQIIHDPILLSAYNNKGLEVDFLGRFEEAVTCFTRAIEVDPLSPEPWLNMGITLRKMRQYYRSIKCYKRAIDIDPNYVKAWNNMGHVYYLLKKYRKAINSFRKATQTDPSFADGWFNIGLSLFEWNKHREALFYFEKARELNAADIQTSDYIERCRSSGGPQ